jgi:hypothetical protein
MIRHSLAVAALLSLAASAAVAQSNSGVASPQASPPPPAISVKPVSSDSQTTATQVTLHVETVKADPNAIANQKNVTSDTVVCRSMGPASGSRLGDRRECKTQREWDRDQAEQQHRLSRNQVRGCGSTSCN